MTAAKSCTDCRHSRRQQTGPHSWDLDCSLRQITFPDAVECVFYQPPSSPDFGRESSGLGYIWDSEYEGRP